MFGWLRRTADLFGAPRSGAWPRVRREHLAEHPACAACGRAREVEVHHVIPFHDQPELELDATNLVTLCADPCHFVHGHLLNWKRSNPHVRSDAAQYRKRMAEYGCAEET
jgi:5-methylcytosine-specific restriction endonuclease McrA